MHELEPLVDEKVPIAHEVHVDAPAAEYFPAVQARQAEAPAAEYVPAVQEEHEPAPAAEYVPAVHVPVGAVRPAVAQ